MTASAQSFSYNATPEPGTVPELATVEIIFPEWDEIEINSKDDITATLDGTAIEGVNAKVTYGKSLPLHPQSGSRESRGADYSHHHIPGIHGG